MCIRDSVPAIEEPATPEIEQDQSLPLVHLIHTGGTIASKVDYATGAVTARFDPHELLDAVPELRGIARIRAVKLGNMWSDDIRPRHWNRMLRATEESFAEMDSDGKGMVLLIEFYKWVEKAESEGGTEAGAALCVGEDDSDDDGDGVTQIDEFKNGDAAAEWRSI